MKKSVPLLISLCMLLAAFLTLVSCPSNNGEEGPSLISMELVYQHKDTYMLCDLCTAVESAPHAENHAAGPNGIYGDGDDCPHCSTYCAPASIAMIATAYGRTAEKIQQDWIYDGGKDLPDTQEDGNLTTRGVGMFHGVGSPYSEVQDAMDFALRPMTHEEYNAGNPLTQAFLKTCIENRRPIHCLDHNGWPKNQSSEYPPPFEKSEQGHAKVIAGYDDGGTSDSSDDRCLIYDPWPEYNDEQDISLLPTGATKGPDDTFDPYWLPASSIIGDVNDVFLVPLNSIE